MLFHPQRPTFTHAPVRFFFLKYHTSVGCIIIRSPLSLYLSIKCCVSLPNSDFFLYFISSSPTNNYSGFCSFSSQITHERRLRLYPFCQQGSHVDIISCSLLIGIVYISVITLTPLCPSLLNVPRCVPSAPQF